MHGAVTGLMFIRTLRRGVFGRSREVGRVPLSERGLARPPVLTRILLYEPLLGVLVFLVGE